MLGVAAREVLGTRQPLLDRRATARLHVRVRELAQRADEALAMTAVLGDRDRLVQDGGALLVAPAHGVDERGAERQQGARVGRAVAAGRGLGARLAQSGDAVLDGAGRKGGLPRLEVCARGDPVAADGVALGASAGRALDRRRGLDAELAAEQAPARVDLRERRGPIAARRERAHEQLVVRLLERVERHEPRGQFGGALGIPGGQLVERVLVENGGGLAGVAPARHQQPRLERRARVELHVLEQLAAGGGRALARVDHDAGRERQLDRVAGDRRRVAERAPQLGQVPAQRAERIVSVGEQQLRQTAPADRPLGQQQVGEQRPGLAPARGGSRLTVAKNGGLTQQSDTGLHVVTLA